MSGFFIDIIPGVDSDSNRNEYQEYLLWDKGGRCVGLTTLAPSSADSLKIWGPQLPRYVWSEVGLYRNCCTFPFIYIYIYIYIYMCVCVCVCVCVNVDVFNNWQTTVISLDEF